MLTQRQRARRPGPALREAATQRLRPSGGRYQHLENTEQVRKHVQRNSSQLAPRQLVFDVRRCPLEGLTPLTPCGAAGRWGMVAVVAAGSLLLILVCYSSVSVSGERQQYFPCSVTLPSHVALAALMLSLLASPR